MSTLANDRIVFIHVPKTGGTWATEAMRVAGVEFSKVGDDDHLTKGDLDIGDRFSFAFVREPMSWYWSVWKFHRECHRSHHWAKISDYVDLEFPEFLESMVKNHHAYLSIYYRLFVGPPDDEVSFVGQYERLRSDLAAALKLAGQQFDEAALRGEPARNFDDEVKLYGLALPPRSDPPECSDDLKAALFESEREVYDRFYGGDQSAQPVGPATATGRGQGISTEIRSQAPYPTSQDDPRPRGLVPHGRPRRWGLHSIGGL